MQLTEITEELCSVCGKEPISELRSSQHSNGHWYESRVFACGRHLKFSPNFMRVSVDAECPKHPEEEARIAHNERCKADLVSYIERSNATDDFKTNAIRALEFV